MNDILKTTAHRPFPLPEKRNWILKQAWHDIAFLHWQIAPEKLRNLIPSELEIDTFEGSAWVGMIIFNLNSIFLRGLPRISLTPTFPEINLRTYVTYQGIPGIYFLSIDVDHWASQVIAKRWYHLPYQPATMTYDKFQTAYQFDSIRKRDNKITSVGSVTPYGQPYIADKASLDYFLIERYRLYSSDKSQRVYQADIHHQPWPLYKGEAALTENMILADLHLDLDVKNPQLTHFSPGVDALLWQINKLQIPPT